MEKTEIFVYEYFKKSTRLSLPASLAVLSNMMLSKGAPSQKKTMMLWSVKAYTLSAADIAKLNFPGPE